MLNQSIDNLKGNQIISLLTFIINLQYIIQELT